MDIKKLLRNYATGTACSDQVQELENLLKQGRHDEEIKNLLEKMAREEKLHNNANETKLEGIIQNILKPTGRVFIWKRWVAAASVLFVVCSLWFVVSRKDRKSDSPKDQVADVKAPAGSKAVIKLADGREIPIDSLSTLFQGSVQLVKTADGRLEYKPLASSPQRVAMYNTLTNPRGSKVIDMTLSDGSHVWLNAGSSITYPVAFVENQRNVKMTGEAYFEIAASPNPSKGGGKRPFIVEANGTKTEVLGTHFNVNAYEDEVATKITLLEGSVKVFTNYDLRGTNAEAMLRPGEQGEVNRNSSIIIRNSVDLDEVMSWKNELFVFSGNKIQTVMRQLGRWYDVEISYQGTITNEDFVGMLSRSENVSQVLKMMESTKKVKFEIKGKSITVRSP